MDNQTLISTEEPGSSEEEVRDWLELPSDVLSHIFLKLGAIDILFSAQSVCPVWRKISKEPLLFRSIDMRNMCHSLHGNMYDVEKMVREAVGRSCGQLVEFSMDSSGSGELLAYISDKSAELRCLRLVSSHQLSVAAVINVSKKAVMLEELEICHCPFSEDTLHMLISVGNACPQIRSFCLSIQGYRYAHFGCDDEALAIAENMPQLRHLHLIGKNLTNVGLKAILDGCLHLQSLDLRQCFIVNLEEDLLKSCRDRLIELRFPNDSTDDYGFDAAIDDGSYGFSERKYDPYLDFCYSDSDNDFDNNSYLDFCYYDPDLNYDNEAPFDPDYYV